MNFANGMPRSVSPSVMCDRFRFGTSSSSGVAGAFFASAMVYGVVDGCFKEKMDEKLGGMEVWCGGQR
eukprot:scaffold3240_cov187-Amphora_coffeaeformis.AAC.6